MNEQHDAHVKTRDRHLDWCSEQWCLSNGISVVTECGTLIQSEPEPEPEPDDWEPPQRDRDRFPQF